MLRRNDAVTDRIYYPFQYKISIWNSINLTQDEMHTKRSLFPCVFYCNGISTFIRYLMSKPSLQKDSSSIIDPHRGASGSVMVSKLD